MTVVTTKQELEVAKGRGEVEIIVEGELADKLKKAKKVTMVGAGTLALLTVAIGAATVAAPVTGGVSYFMAAPIAAMSGLDVAAIILASAVGLALLIALFKDYEEISYSDGRMVLRKRQRDSGEK
jgi:uncharacterized membrane protein